MITLDELRAFKTQFSDENHRIATILRTHFLEYAQSPILDVGAGLGDISRTAFPDREVVLLDRLNTTGDAIARHHDSVIADFFEYDAQRHFHTLFFCHVLQFLDEDPARLIERTQSFSPRAIIVVENTNDDFMGKLIDWGSRSIKDINPEVPLVGFPPDFRADKSIAFSGSVECDSFAELSRQVHYLLDCMWASVQETQQFLEAHLDTPRFTINQRVTAYLPCQTT